MQDPEHDGRDRLPPGDDRTSLSTTEEIVIPVVAEELTIETARIARARVRVNKRVETREEVVDTPLVVEEVAVEHVPINKVVLDGDAIPAVREEDGVLVIPILEEVAVIHKQLVIREEVRVFKRRTTTNRPETVVLRREVIDIQREDLTGAESPDTREASRARTE